MDEQLKRRLVGTAITVALLVIFVPMLFEDSQPPAGTAGEVPALPEAIEERTIELPKSAADVAREEEAAQPKKAPASGYRVIPLDEAPPKPSKPAAPEKVQGASEAAEAPGGEQAAANLRDAPAEETAEFEEEGPKPTTPSGSESPPMKAKVSTEGAHSPPKKSAAPDAGAVRQAAPSKPKAAAVAKPAGKAKPVQPSPSRPATPKPETQPPRSTGPRPAAGAEAAKPADAASAGEASPTASAPKSPPPDAAASAKPQEPKRSTTEQTPSTPASWIVQAGTFSAENNARTLADKLRKQNLPAVVRPYRGDTATLYRVTIGSGSSKARAEQIQKQVEASVGIRGILLPQR